MLTGLLHGCSFTLSLCPNRSESLFTTCLLHGRGSRAGCPRGPENRHFGQTPRLTLPMLVWEPLGSSDVSAERPRGHRGACLEPARRFIHLHTVDMCGWVIPGGAEGRPCWLWGVEPQPWPLPTSPDTTKCSLGQCHPQLRTYT